MVEAVTPRRYYFGLYVLLRGAVICLVPVVFATTKQQVILVSGTLWLYALTQQSLQPWRSLRRVLRARHVRRRARSACTCRHASSIMEIRGRCRRLAHMIARKQQRASLEAISVRAQECHAAHMSPAPLLVSLVPSVFLLLCLLFAQGLRQSMFEVASQGVEQCTACIRTRRARPPTSLLGSGGFSPESGSNRVALRHDFFTPEDLQREMARAS